MRDHNTQIIACIGNLDPITHLEEIISSGADGLRICVRRSYDNKLVVSEAPTWDTTVEALRERGIRTLEKVLEACADRIPLVIEIPPRERIVIGVVATIKVYGGRVTLASSSLITACTAQVEMPELSIHLICLEEGREVERVRMAGYYGFTAVTMPFHAISQHVMDQATELNVGINGFTVDTIEYGRSLAKLGVSVIFTNNPKLLKEKL